MPLPYVFSVVCCAFVIFAFIVGLLVCIFESPNEKMEVSARDAVVYSAVLFLVSSVIWITK